MPMTESPTTDVETPLRQYELVARAIRYLRALRHPVLAKLLR
jgi:hypothetical protein